MAKPDLEDGYLRIAHELFAALACAGFNKWEWVVIREVLNQIYGPRRKKTATISPSEIAKEVSTHKQSIARATGTLIESGVLVKVGDMEYRFIKDYEAWRNNGAARLSTFEGSYCGKAKTINASTKSVNKGAYDTSTKSGNKGADASTKHVNNSADGVSAGAYERQHGRLRSSAPALTPIPAPPDPPIEEPARGIEKGEEERVCAEDTRTPTEFETGRKGLEHAKFVDAWRLLKGHKSTIHLAKGLLMAADTPEVRSFQPWRIWVGAMVAQRPDKSKEWGSFLGFCRKATEYEYQKLRATQEPTKPETPTTYHRASPEFRNSYRGTK